MAGQTINMVRLKQIIRLRGNNVALQTIAKAVNISRNTVKKYLHLIEIKQLNFNDLLAMEDNEIEALLMDTGIPDPERYQSLSRLFPYFDKELSRTGVNRWVLWGEYRSHHPDGYSYPQFCDRYSKWKATASGSFHQEYHPGEKVFIDYTGKKLSVVDTAFYTDDAIRRIAFTQGGDIELILANDINEMIKKGVKKAYPIH